MVEDRVVVTVDADTVQFDKAMAALTQTTRDFGKVFTSTITNSVKSGRGLESTLRSIGQRMADLALNQALAPLENLFSNFVNTLVSGAGSAGGGGGGSASTVVPFAMGGVVTSPVQFGFGGRLGLMGEAGPEAIMPLKRGADGKLGVAASNPQAAMNVVFNVTTSDAASFKKSEGQVTALLARAVARGRRGL